MKANPPNKRKAKQLEKCIHCGRKCRKDEGRVCDKCYSQYTPGMLYDVDDEPT